VNARLTELLPWYVNGTIDDADRRWVDEQLAASAEARAELAWHRSMLERIREDAPDVSDEIGLDRAMAMIHRESAAAARIEAARAASRPSVLARLGDWLRGVGLTPALGAAAAVIAIQGIVILGLVRGGEPPYTDIRSSGQPSSTPTTTLKVNFRPDAKETDLRLLVVEIQGTLIGGPGQLGDYYIAVAPARADAAVATLRASPIVEGAVVVPGLPARD